MGTSIEKVRIKWIDCAKTIAMMAVVLDHCYAVLYSNIRIQEASFFATSLFILLSGVSTERTSRNKAAKTIKQQLRKIGTFFQEYAMATFVIYIISFRTFDLLTYISHVMNFTIASQFYFLVFFFQLLLISPVLVTWCRMCESFKYKYVWHIATLLAIGCMAHIFIKYTYILPLHGAGKYMFGGTYLLVYYIGILLGNFKVFERKREWGIFVISILSWILWWYLGIIDVLPFDKLMEPYWGEGLNPPSVKLIILGIITCFLCYSAFSLLEKYGKGIGKKIVDLFSILGQYTLYTFMYHRLVLKILGKCFPNMLYYNIVIRILFWLLAIILPVVGVIIIKRLKKLFLDKKVNWEFENA